MKYADFFDPPDGELGANLGSGGGSEEDDENEEAEVGITLFWEVSGWDSHQTFPD